VETRSASLPSLSGALAPPACVYAAARLAAFLIAYAIAASGSRPRSAGAAPSGVTDKPAPPVKGLRDAVPLPPTASAATVEPSAQVAG
jgi:hypothetical protein